MYSLFTTVTTNDWIKENKNMRYEKKIDMVVKSTRNKLKQGARCKIPKYLTGTPLSSAIT